jgi:glyoxylase-like metal-dependent hydrolase (beta-lactamase superfamily II)
MSANSAFTSRRQFLGIAATAAAAAMVSRVSAAEGTPPPAPKKPHNPFVYAFKVGEMEAWSISDGHMLFREGVNLMWPEEARPAMRDDLKIRGERLDALPMYINILVLRSGNEVAIFDAGFGRVSNPDLGWLAEGLKQIGIEHGAVTAAFLSHAHADHIGGFVTDGKPTFHNAALYALKSEVDFWRSPEPDFSKTKRPRGQLPGMIRDARNKFDVLQPNLQLLKGGETVFNGAVVVEAAPGHTAGHLICRVQSGQESLLHLMDVAHHHSLMFTDPAWNIAFDHDAEQAVDTRKKLFAKLSITHERTYGFHLPWPGLGRIAARGTGYGWDAERWVWSS